MCRNVVYCLLMQPVHQKTVENVYFLQTAYRVQETFFFRSCVFCFLKKLPQYFLNRMQNLYTFFCINKYIHTYIETCVYSRYILAIYTIQIVVYRRGKIKTGKKEKIIPTTKCQPLQYCVPAAAFAFNCHLFVQRSIKNKL